MGKVFRKRKEKSDLRKNPIIQWYTATTMMRYIDQKMLKLPSYKSRLCEEGSKTSGGGKADGSLHASTGVGEWWGLAVRSSVKNTR